MKRLQVLHSSLLPCDVRATCTSACNTCNSACTSACNTCNTTWVLDRISFLLEAHQVAPPELRFKMQIHTYRFETPCVCVCEGTLGVFCEILRVCVSRVCVCDCTLGVFCEILRVRVCPHTTTYICVLMLTGRGSCFSTANIQITPRKLSTKSPCHCIYHHIFFVKKKEESNLGACTC